MINKNIIILLGLLLVIIPQKNAFSFWGFLASKKVTESVVESISAVARLSKNTKTLPDNEIVRLSNLAIEFKGTFSVGKALSRLNLPNDVLEDTFMRIAIYQQKIARQDAEAMFSILSGIPGFRSTLSKIIGNSDEVIKGSLNELKIARSASENGYKVIGIAEKFNDGIKSRLTDIDVIFEKNGKIFAIEAKDYKPTTGIKLDNWKADMNTLIQYKISRPKDKIIPIFTITNNPNNQQHLKILQQYADKHGIQLIVGSPQEQIEQIKMLGEIL